MKSPQELFSQEAVRAATEKLTKMAPVHGELCFISSFLPGPPPPTQADAAHTESNSAS